MAARDVPWLLALRLWFGRAIGRETIRDRRDRLTEQAKRKAEREGVLYDAYRETPRKVPRLRLVIIGGSLMQTVNLDGYSLHEVKLRHPARGRRVLEAIIEARAHIEARLDVPETPE